MKNDFNEEWWKVENEDCVPTPTVLIYPDRVNENLDRMIAWCRYPSTLRPHVKTHKLPQIVSLKLAKGIRKFKAATIAEVEMVAAAGGQDILLAMQQSGANFSRLLKLVDKFPSCRISTVVDDLEHLDWMHSQIQNSTGKLPLLVDLNVGMNRTGTSVGEYSRRLYEKIVQYSRGAHAKLEIGGIHAYDGHLHQTDLRELTSNTVEAFAPVWEFCDQLERAGYPVPSIVVSGTPTSPILGAENRERVELSAGTTVLWDAGQQRTCPNMHFLNAALVLTRVISRPSKNLLCLDLGHKAVASEFPHPRVQLLGLEDARPVIHSEEHLVIETRNSDSYSIGSLVYGIPYHICPTVALHSHVWPVQNGRVNDYWPVVGRDRIITV